MKLKLKGVHYFVLGVVITLVAVMIFKKTQEGFQPGSNLSPEQLKARADYVLSEFATMSDSVLKSKLRTGIEKDKNIPVKVFTRPLSELTDSEIISLRTAIAGTAGIKKGDTVAQVRTKIKNFNVGQLASFVGNMPGGTLRYVIKKMTTQEVALGLFVIVPPAPIAAPPTPGGDLVLRMTQQRMMPGIEITKDQSPMSMLFRTA